jgi:predicted TIM-barrel fold metal-dependent hydrolase
MNASNLMVPLPPNPNPGQPKLVAPPGSWDMHFHVFGPPNLFPYAEARRYTPPTAPIEHWFEMASAIGISNGLLVTPSVHDLDPAVTLDAIRKSEGRLRGVIRANNELTPEEVKRLHDGGIRGLRFPFAAVVRRTFDEKQVRHNVARIEAASWFAEFQIDGNALEQHAELIAGVPVPVMIDEFGGVQPKHGLDQPSFRILLDLLARKNIWLKLTCADRFLREGTRYEDIVAMSRAVIAKAPERIIWGTDWPHAYIYKARMMPDDAELLDMLLDFAPDEKIRSQILVDNPRRLLNL